MLTRGIIRSVWFAKAAPSAGAGAAVQVPTQCVSSLTAKPVPSDARSWSGLLPRSGDYNMRAVRSRRLSMLRTGRTLVVLLVLGLALIGPRAPWSAAPQAQSQRAAISRSGVLGGANYLIEVPASWRGGLVVFAHGIQRGPGPGAVAAPPMASHIVAEGHAWIASGYRARECQPHLFVEDLVALRELFFKEIGKPRWSIIYGQSMGGHIVVASLELKPALYQGGLAECGLVDGISIVDYLLAYTAAAELAEPSTSVTRSTPVSVSPRTSSTRASGGCVHRRTVVRLM